MKRTFDILASILALAILSPLLLLVAMLVKFTSPGPVFYRQVRAGLNGTSFKILKFRKMTAATTGGAMLTTRQDARLTHFGRFLALTKLDELPQLFNVLNGSMSLVGPRPEVWPFVDMKSSEWKTILSVRPGIFGAAQLKHLNEAALFPVGCADVERFYRENILPSKMAIDVAYTRNQSFPNDLAILVRNIIAIMSPVSG